MVTIYFLLYGNYNFACIRHMWVKHSLTVAFDPFMYNVE